MRGSFSSKCFARFGAAALLVVGLLVAAAPTAAAVAAAEPVWNSGSKGWQGSGSLFLPGAYIGGGGDSGGVSGSNCVGCRWVLTHYCPEAPEFGVSCALNPSMGCPSGDRRYVVWFARAGGNLTPLVELPCIGPGQRPVSGAEMGAFIRDRVNQSAPRQRIGVQPANGALTQLPAVFRSGQPASISRTDSIAGFSVRFRATASWRWGWGDGTTTTTTRPGGRYPNMSVAHTYRRSGQLRVRLRTRWTASFTVDGRGPYNVAGGPVTQSGELGLLVRQSRAVLVQDS